jgi:hypothetical protein
MALPEKKLEVLKLADYLQLCGYKVKVLKDLSGAHFPPKRNSEPHINLRIDANNSKRRSKMKPYFEDLRVWKCLSTTWG